MTQAAESQSVASRSTDLLDEVRESAKVGQHAAAEALRIFRQTVDEAIPDAVQPLRTKIVDAAIEGRQARRRAVHVGAGRSGIG
ncbi:MAG TPA: hypothetical protein VME67_00685 [Mycobacterium sp.]|nr:hypothetical protein [Mycobacterium sp.]HTX93463.1 hypothetical protein [Mycobacterium sp.]